MPASRKANPGSPGPSSVNAGSRQSKSPAPPESPAPHSESGGTQRSEPAPHSESGGTRKSPSTSGASAAGLSHLSVLFIGNSFTARNDVPGLVAGLAAARGRRFEHQLISMGGASLRMHWNKGAAQKLIGKGGYDFVVLQEQSTLPVKGRTRMHENVRLFDEAIRGAGSRTVLYLTWARRHTPEAQDVITEAYTSIGREIGATVVPVGIAWKRFMAAHEKPVLHDKDDSHPTVAGSYLAACVFYGVLFGDSPEGEAPAVKGLSAEDSALLRRGAAEAIGEGRTG